MTKIIQWVTTMASETPKSAVSLVEQGSILNNSSLHLVGYLGKNFETTTTSPDGYCPVCKAKDKKQALRTYRLNFTQSIYLCSDPQCIYPLGYTPLADVIKNTEDLKKSCHQSKQKKRNFLETSPTNKACIKKMKTDPSVFMDFDSKNNFSCSQVKNSNHAPLTVTPASGVTMVPNPSMFCLNDYRLQTEQNLMESLSHCSSSSTTTLLLNGKRESPDDEPKREFSQDHKMLHVKEMQKELTRLNDLNDGTASNISKLTSMINGHEENMGNSSDKVNASVINDYSEVQENRPTAFSSVTEKIVCEPSVLMHVKYGVETVNATCSSIPNSEIIEAIGSNLCGQIAGELTGSLKCTLQNSEPGKDGQEDSALEVFSASVNMVELSDDNLNLSNTLIECKVSEPVGLTKHGQSPCNPKDSASTLQFEHGLQESSLVKVGTEAAVVHGNGGVTLSDSSLTECKVSEPVCLPIHGHSPCNPTDSPNFLEQSRSEHGLQESSSNKVCSEAAVVQGNESMTLSAMSLINCKVSEFVCLPEHGQSPCNPIDSPDLQKRRSEHGLQESSSMKVGTEAHVQDSEPEKNRQEDSALEVFSPSVNIVERSNENLNLSDTLIECKVSEPVCLTKHGQSLCNPKDSANTLQLELGLHEISSIDVGTDAEAVVLGNESMTVSDISLTEDKVSELICSTKHGHRPWDHTDFPILLQRRTSGHGLQERSLNEMCNEAAVVQAIERMTLSDTSLKECKVSKPEYNSTESLNPLQKRSECGLQKSSSIKVLTEAAVVQGNESVTLSDTSATECKVSEPVCLTKQGQSPSNSTDSSNLQQRRSEFGLQESSLIKVCTEPAAVQGDESVTLSDTSLTECKASESVCLTEPGQSPCNSTDSSDLPENSLIEVNTEVDVVLVNENMTLSDTSLTECKASESVCLTEQGQSPCNSTDSSDLLQMKSDLAENSFIEVDVVLVNENMTLSDTSLTECKLTEPECSPTHSLNPLQQKRAEHGLPENTPDEVGTEATFVQGIESIKPNSALLVKYELHRTPDLVQICQREVKHARSPSLVSIPVEGNSLMEVCNTDLVTTLPSVNTCNTKIVLSSLGDTIMGSPIRQNNVVAMASPFNHVYTEESKDVPEPEMSSLVPVLQRKCVNLSAEKSCPTDNAPEEPLLDPQPASEKANPQTPNKTCKYLQWRNKFSLCWLNCILAFLVHSSTLKNFVAESGFMEESVIHILFAKYKEANAIVTSTSHRSKRGYPKNLSAAQKCLEEVRMVLFDTIKIPLKCKLGDKETPVFALPLLLKQDPKFEELFVHSYSWSFSCNLCGYQHQECCEKTMTTFTNIAPDWSPLNAVHIAPCNKCQDTGQKRKMNLEKIHSIFMVHFVEGLPSNNLKLYSFKFEEHLYEAKGVIRYHGDHFSTWIANDDGTWMESDDLRGSYCKNHLCFGVPPAEIHIVIWERSTSKFTEEENQKSTEGDDCQALSSHSASPSGPIPSPASTELPKENSSVLQAESITPKKSDLLFGFEGYADDDIITLTLTEIPVDSLGKPIETDLAPVIVTPTEHANGMATVSSNSNTLNVPCAVDHIQSSGKLEPDVAKSVKILHTKPASHSTDLSPNSVASVKPANLCAETSPDTVKKGVVGSWVKSLLNKNPSLASTLIVSNTKSTTINKDYCSPLKLTDAKKAQSFGAFRAKGVLSNNHAKDTLQNGTPVRSLMPKSNTSSSDQTFHTPSIPNQLTRGRNETNNGRLQAKDRRSYSEDKIRKLRIKLLKKLKAKKNELATLETLAKTQHNNSTADQMNPAPQANVFKRRDHLRDFLQELQDHIDNADNESVCTMSSNASLCSSPGDAEFFAELFSPSSTTTVKENDDSRFLEMLVDGFSTSVPSYPTDSPQLSVNNFATCNPPPQKPCSGSTSSITNSSFENSAMDDHFDFLSMETKNEESHYIDSFDDIF
ncbi:SUMO-specific isopeptidase USPL1 isoform X1 [Pelobates cultripes]|uniref:SUMO-specific isopeptidase USPL1 isoform X1 n=1 Tax=Pelobates cultripes TaxID=61616 RepID=A0AAD1R729_PELCU|nr:SUMO-specific isopeptidase USPL1 isoform X1 [Pelobates cultripes]